MEVLAAVAVRGFEGFELLGSEVVKVDVEIMKYEK